MGYVGTKPTDAPLTSSQLDDGIVTAAKIATDAVETAKVKDLNVSTGKLAASAVTQAKTDFIATSSTAAVIAKGTSGDTDGYIQLNCAENTHGIKLKSPTHASAQSYTLTFPGSAPATDKFLQTNASGVLSFASVDTGEGPIPTITTSSLLAEPTSDTTLTLAGTNFVSIPKVEIIASTGAIVTAPTVTFTSATALDFTTGATLVAGTYFIRVINPDYGAVTTSSALFTVSPGPAWVTSAGSLGSFAGGASIGTVNLTATDSTGMTLQSGSFPGGVSLTSGSGTSTLTGTETGSSATTVYTFTIRATDAEVQTADREFSITISHGLEQGMAFIQDFIMATTYLSRAQGTPTGAGKKATVSCWVKMSVGGGSRGFFESRNAATTHSFDVYADGDKIQVGILESSSWVGYLTASGKSYDSSAWYHVCCVWDSTQAAAGDRFQLWVNGVQPALGTETIPSQDQTSTALSSSVSTTQQWGKYAQTGTSYLDGYMAQCVYVDGAAYAVTTFGSFDATTGEWKPKSDGEIRTAVTFGDQGCLLPFSNASYLGYDYQTSDRSGTTNDFTVTGSGYKAQDNPSNNFCTLNNNYSATGQYSTAGNTTTYANLAGYPAAGNNGLAATMGASKGKWYWESRPVSASTMTGMMSGSAAALGSWDGSYADGFTSYAGNKAIMYGTEAGAGYLMGVTTSTAAFGTILNNSTDVVGVAMDLDNNNLYFSVNGTWQNSGVPTSGATGTGAVAITVQSGQPALGKEFWLPALHTFSSSSTVEFNFGQGYFGTTSVGATNADDAGQGVFKYDVPAGFYALCTRNLKTYGQELWHTQQ